MLNDRQARRVRQVHPERASSSPKRIHRTSSTYLIAFITIERFTFVLIATKNNGRRNHQPPARCLRRVHPNSPHRQHPLHPRSPTPRTNAPTQPHPTPTQPRHRNARSSCTPPIPPPPAGATFSHPFRSNRPTNQENPVIPASTPPNEPRSHTAHPHPSHATHRNAHPARQWHGRCGGRAADAVESSKSWGAGEAVFERESHGGAVGGDEEAGC